MAHHSADLTRPWADVLSGLSLRVKAALRKRGSVTVADVVAAVATGELLDQPLFGRASLRELRGRLEALGIVLPGPPDPPVASPEAPAVPESLRRRPWDGLLPLTPRVEAHLRERGLGTIGAVQDAAAGGGLLDPPRFGPIALAQLRCALAAVLPALLAAGQPVVTPSTPGSSPSGGASPRRGGRRPHAAAHDGADAGAPDLTGIKRKDNGETGDHGFEVALLRRGVWHRRYFPDRRHGGREPALAAALAWRDAIRAAHPSYTVQEFGALTARGSNSGHTGVYRQEKTTRDGRTYGVFYAFWPRVRGRRHSECFSGLAYGEERALELAVAARERGMAELRRRFRDFDDLHRATENVPAPRRRAFPDAVISQVRVEARRLAVNLRDGRLLSIPYAHFDTLAAAEAATRRGWEFHEDRRGLSWPALGLDLRVADLFVLDPDPVPKVAPGRPAR